MDGNPGDIGSGSWLIPAEIGQFCGRVFRVMTAFRYVSDIDQSALATFVEVRRVFDPKIRQTVIYF